MKKHPVPKYDPSRNQWYARWRAKRYYLGTSEAHAWRRLAEIVYAVESLPTDEAPISVAGACSQWCATHGGEWQRLMLRFYVGWAGDKPLAQVGHDHLHQLLRHIQSLTFSPYKSRTPKPRKYGRRVQRAVVGLARSVLAWAHAQGWLPAVPPSPTIPRSVVIPRDVSPDVLDKAFATMPKRALAVCRFIVATGCRTSEATTLRWDQVDLRQRVAIREVHKTDRTGKARQIFLSDEALAILEALPDREGFVFRSRLGKPYTAKGLYRIVRRCGLPGTYCLRHTFAQRCADAGVQLDDIAGLLGHANLATVQRYAQVRADRLRRVASSLSRIGPAQPPAVPGPVAAGRRRKSAG